MIAQYDYARELRTELLSVEDVVNVQINGAPSEAIFVEVSRERANALGVSIDQIYNDLSQQNSVVSAGSVQLGNQRLVISPGGSIDSVTAIESFIVSTASTGTLVYLRDIANVQRGYQDSPSLVIRYNGRPAIGMGVSNVTGANVSTMGKTIDAKLEAASERRPIEIEIHEYYHQGKIVDVAVLDFAINVVLALLIVLVTLLIFMGLRSAIIIGSVLILTIAATLATMYLVAIPMHRISLGALIIALGMLVDNAIVVTEGIVVGVQNGRRKLDIASEIVRKTKWPLLGGTIVGIIAFAPIGLAPGSTAEYAGHLYWVVMISLMYSWIFAITAVPLLADILFKETPGAIDGKADGKLMRGYKTFMSGVLPTRFLVIGIVLALFAVSIYGLQFVKAGFFPPSTTPQIVVDYWLPEGTDSSKTTADMLAMEPVMAELDGVNQVQSLIGSGALRYMLVYAPEAPNTSYGQFLLKVDDYNLIASLIPKIQSYIDENFPNAQAKVWQFQPGPGGGSKIEAEFSGPDPDVLRRLANEAKAIMAADGGALSIKDDWRQPVAKIVPRYNETRGRRLGVSREDLANALQTNYSGKSVGVFREEDKLIPMYQQ